MNTETLTPEALYREGDFNTHHPELRDSEVFLGNFTDVDAMTIGWKTKRAGNRAYYADGSPYLYQTERKVRPYFADLNELREAGVL